MLITALRGLAVAFAKQLIVTVPLPLPDAGLTNAHAWLLDTCQSVFDVTAMVAVELAA